MNKGDVVRLREPFGELVVTRLYEVAGIGPESVRLKGERGYHSVGLLKRVEPDELEAIEVKVAQLMGQLVHQARVSRAFNDSINPGVVLGMVLTQLLKEERDGREASSDAESESAEVETA